MLGDFAQVQGPYLLDGLDQLLRQRVADAGGFEAYYLQLHLGARVVESGGAGSGA